LQRLTGARRLHLYDHSAQRDRLCVRQQQSGLPDRQRPGCEDFLLQVLSGRETELDGALLDPLVEVIQERTQDDSPLRGMLTSVIREAIPF